ncbi:hypothetical protein NIES37_54940 [Tolypothrix tenuis PCC 7101]|uniref:DUF192 domain-containing protein n=1 Tax=Tolypothrix tenuis PCC 7101 TaxID=231146 RepID=A0A1Z4N757_9CYAN|nr:DUF192 domain-containing protein [Aulosira sp. FACHB-113]BAZ01492.1 hypothetical protein NIES37_54940 [Tolypothrix tenuis PCC 7101]BAZ74585.1 hypothetical protein NIES50_31610 [Aulosira laxa NIES-50]
MLKLLSFISILLSVLLMGCSPPTTAKPPSTTSGSQTQAPVSAGQQLSITAEATVPNNTKIQLEVAQTPEQQEMGLMYRKSLPDNRGMLFKFPSAQAVRFWMKNTLIPLDMVFMQNGVVKYIKTSAPPCTSDPCPTYGPNTLVDTVIELRAGRATELGLKLGDSIKIKFLPSATLRK